MLYLFDVDGTLIRSFLREGAPRADFDVIEVLPGRREKLREIRAKGAGQERVEMALVSNQGGVALGYQTVPQVCVKLTEVMIELGFVPSLIRTGPSELVDLYGWPVADDGEYQPRAYVAFGLTDRPGLLPGYAVALEDEWRKPGPGMILQAMHDHRASADDTVFIGDMDTDRAAAERAGVRYFDARELFGC